MVKTLTEKIENIIVSYNIQYENGYLVWKLYNRKNSSVDILTQFFVTSILFFWNRFWNKKYFRSLEWVKMNFRSFNLKKTRPPWLGFTITWLNLGHNAGCSCQDCKDDYNGRFSFHFDVDIYTEKQIKVTCWWDPDNLQKSLYLYIFIYTLPLAPVNAWRKPSNLSIINDSTTLHNTSFWETDMLVLSLLFIYISHSCNYDMVCYFVWFWAIM